MPRLSILAALLQINQGTLVNFHVPEKALEDLEEAAEGDYAESYFLREAKLSPVSGIHARSGGDHETVGQLFYICKLPYDTAFRLTDDLWVIMGEELVSGILVTDAEMQKRCPVEVRTAVTAAMGD